MFSKCLEHKFGIKENVGDNVLDWHSNFFVCPCCYWTFLNKVMQNAWNVILVWKEDNCYFTSMKHYHFHRTYLLQFYLTLSSNNSVVLLSITLPWKMRKIYIYPHKYVQNKHLNNCLLKQYLLHVFEKPQSIVYQVCFISCVVIELPQRYIIYINLIS